MTSFLGTAEQSDRRGRQPAIPPNYNALLTQDQKNALRNIENFGWQLAFVRRPSFETPLFVVRSPDQQRLAVIESDGEVNMHPDLPLRH